MLIRNVMWQYVLQRLKTRLDFLTHTIDFKSIGSIEYTVLVESKFYSTFVEYILNL